MNLLGLRVPATIGGCISTTSLLYGIGAVGAIVIINQLLRNSKPFLVSTTKEAISF